MILVNGVAADSVAATDRGLAYGDGVFRTLLVSQGKPRCWSRHYRKLGQDCAALAIACPPEDLLAQELARAAGTTRDGVGKIIVTRGSGARGYALPQPSAPTRIVTVTALPQHPAAFSRSGITVHLCRIRLSSQPRLAGVKHLNRLENVLARAEWSDPSIAEGLLLDEDGHAISGTMTNLFIVEGGSLLTPGLSRCGVAGVTRDRIMEAAARQGMDCREDEITWQRLLDAQEVLLVNSVIGAWQVRECANRRWEPGGYTGRVREWLNEEED
jgi:4-amino-4-deoxychorismate lyase